MSERIQFNLYAPDGFTVEYRSGHTYMRRKLEEIAITVEQTLASGVKGDLIEFGTAWGHTAEVIAGVAAIASPAAARPIPNFYLMDSFEGLPEVTNEVDTNCHHVKNGGWAPGTCKVLSKEQLFEKIKVYLPPEQIIIMKGWFKDTVPAIPIGTKFAIVHVDGDLYESAIDSLDGLFANDHLSDGCTILFDEWNCNHASPKFGERRAWAEMVEKYKIKYSDCGDYAHMCHKVIVHR